MTATHAGDSTRHGSQQRRIDLREVFGAIPLPELFRSTYFRLRVGLVIVAVAVPGYLILIGGPMAGVDLKDSLSAYYGYSDGIDELRDEFVVLVSTLGVLFLLYRGHTGLEHWALNIAGGAAIGVALVPEGSSWLHGAFAVTAFVAAGYVAIVRSRDTVPLVEDADRRRLLNAFYPALGVVMIAVIAGAALYIHFTDPDRIIIALETVGLLLFALYWAVKTIELRGTDFERRLQNEEFSMHEATRSSIFKPIGLNLANGGSESSDASAAQASPAG